MHVRLFLLAALTLFVGAVPAQTPKADAAKPPKAAPGKATHVPVLNHALVLQIPKGWKKSHEQTDAVRGRFVREYIPPGQSAQNWKEMITVEGFQNLSLDPASHPNDLIKILGSNIQKACKDNFVGQLFGTVRIDNADASIALLGCAKLPLDVPGGLKAGESEVSLYVVLKGVQDMYVIHRSRRGPSFDPATMQRQKLEQWIAPMMPIKLCVRGETETQCLSRPSR